MPHEPTPPPSSTPPPDWEALGRFLSGESAPEEAARVGAWLSAHPEDATVLDAVNAAAGQLGEAIRDPVDTERALAAVLARRIDGTPTASQPDRSLRAIDAPRTVPIARPSRRGMAIGAAAILLLAVGLFAWRTTRLPAAAALNHLAASTGQLDSLLLRDGTLVVLGAGSSIAHAKDFGTTTREVTLRGDGYFDVARDDTRPFTVRAGEAQIVDLGTAFAVRAAAGRGVSVAVTSGRVRLSDVRTPDLALELAAGDVALLPDTSRQPQLDSLAVTEEIAWTRGALAFRDAPIAEMADVLQRWYGVVLVADSALQNRRVTSTLNRESRETILSVLALALGARVDMRGDTARLIADPPSR